MEKIEAQSGVQKDDFSHKKLLVRMVLVSVLAVLAFVATFALENISEKKSISTVTELSYRGSRLNLPSFAYFNSETSDVNDVLTQVSTDISAENSGEYIFKMSNGRAFGNFMNSTLKTNIRVADKVVIIPDFSMFEVTYNEADSTLYLANFGGNTYVGFLPETVKVDGYVDEYDGMLNNVLLVPAGMRAKIYLNRADDRLKTVLSSKLAKEFSYGRIPYDSEKSVDLFDRKNLDEATKYNETLKAYQRDTFKVLADQNYGAASKTYDVLSKVLTVFSQKRNSQYLSKLEGVLYDALTISDPQKMQDKLLIGDLADYGVSEDYYVEFLKRVTSALLCFGSTDSEYNVLTFIVDESKSQLSFVEFADLITATVSHDIYSGKNIEQSYKRAYGGVEKLISGVDDAVKYKKTLTFYNEYFDSLISRFPQLYKLEYFNMKGDIEKALFELYYVGQAREEMKQTFVSEKIAMLKGLKDFFFDEKIAIEDARKVMSYLVQSINDYMPAKTSKNAVISLFESELKDVGNFWGYINNVEYAKSSLYGTTHAERFKVYLAEKSQVTSILDVQRDILGTDVIVAETPSDVQGEVERVLTASGATSVVVEKLKDVQKRYVNVSASLGGYEFNGEYDRDYGYLRNVYAYGQLISESNVKVDALASLLSKTLSDVVANTGLDVRKAVPRDASESAELIAETNAQKIAKTIIAKNVIEAGFNATMEDVDILDPTIALYRINGVSLTGGSNIKVSFDYYANDSIAKNIYIQDGGEGKSIEGEVPFNTLKDIVSNEKI